MTAITHDRRWRITIGALILIIVTGTSTWSVLRANKLIACHRQAINTLDQRDTYTAQLRDLTDRDRENLAILINAVVTPARSPETIREAFVNYQQEADTIDKKRTKIREHQDGYQYPSLKTCE